MRNEKNIKGSILFVSGRPPCNECAPLIAMQGVETVVLDTDEKYDVNKMMHDKDEYKLFPQMVNSGDFVCYRTKKIESKKKPRAQNNKKKTKSKTTKKIENDKKIRSQKRLFKQSRC